MPRWCHSVATWGVSGSETSKPAVVWDLLCPPGLSYWWLADTGGSFMGYAQQADLSMPKNMFIWAIFKAVYYVRIWV